MFQSKLNYLGEDFVKLLRPHSIRANLAVLVAVCLLPILFAAAGVLRYYYQHERSQLLDQTLISARALNNSVESELVSVQTVLEVLATSSYLQSQNPDLAAFHAQATKVLGISGINNVVLISPNEQLVNTARPFGEALPNRWMRPEANSRVFSTGQADISGLELAPVLKQLVLSVSVPVHSGDTVKYVLLGVVLPDRLQTLIKKASLPDEWTAAIYDNSSIIAARSRTPERYIGKSVTPDLAVALKLANEGTREFVTLDGVAVFSAFSRSASTGWGVAIGIPVKTLTAALRQSLWLLAMATALLLAAGLGLAWVQGGRIVAAVRELMHAATKLERGEAVLLPKLPIDEVDEVATAIFKASATLIQTGQALAASEARMRGILESAMDAIITVDADQRIVLYNRSAERTFGWPREQMLGERLDVLMPERFRTAHSEHIGRFSVMGTTTRNMGSGSLIYGRRASGEEFPLEASISQLDTTEGKVFSVILRDITARVLAHQALERSNLHLQQFVFVASHDLKTPLRAISSFVQMLDRNHSDKLDDQARSLIQRSVLATRRLEQLIEDLLSYARADATVATFATVNMAVVAQDVVSSLDAAVTESGALIRIANLPVVQGDRAQLAQLLMNLIGNALKFCRGRPPVVSVSAIRQESTAMWEFSVSDNGFGIENQYLEKIFEVFQRLHTQNEYPGTGMGLAICRRVVESHGGTIWATSVPGEGSIFSFTLPVHTRDNTA